MFGRSNELPRIRLDPPVCARGSTVASCRQQELLAVAAYSDALDTSPESVLAVKRAMARRIDHLLTYHASHLHPDAIRLLRRSGFALRADAAGCRERPLRRWTLWFAYRFRGATIRGGCEIPWTPRTTPPRR